MNVVVVESAPALTMVQPKSSHVAIERVKSMANGAAGLIAVSRAARDSCKFMKKKKV